MQSIKNIPSSCINQEFLELLADIRYYNRKLNNELDSLTPSVHFRNLDRMNNKNHFEQANSYADQIKEDCKKTGIKVIFNKENKIKNEYAKYYLNNKDLTKLINI